MSNSNNKENLKGGLFIQTKPRVVSLGSSLDNLILLRNQANDLNHRINYYLKDSGRVIHQQIIKPSDFKEECTEDLDYNNIKLKISGKKDDVEKAIKIIKKCSIKKSSDDDCNKSTNSKLYYVPKIVQTDTYNLNNTVSNIPPFTPTRINFYDPASGNILHQQTNYNSSSVEKYYCGDDLTVKLCGTSDDVDAAIKCLKDFKKSISTLYSWDNKPIGTTEDLLDAEPASTDDINYVSSGVLFKTPNNIYNMEFLAIKTDNGNTPFGDHLTDSKQAFDNANNMLFLKSNGAVRFSDKVKENQLSFINLHKEDDKYEKIYIVEFEKAQLYEIKTKFDDNKLLKEKQELCFTNELKNKNLVELLNNNNISKKELKLNGPQNINDFKLIENLGKELVNDKKVDTYYIDLKNN